MGNTMEFRRRRGRSLARRLEPSTHVQALIDALMLYLSTSEVIITHELLEIERHHLGDTADFSTLEELRDVLIDLVSVRDLEYKPDALFALFRTFMQRISLPVVHFFDLVLPQLAPVQAPWAAAAKRFWSCHRITSRTDHRPAAAAKNSRRVFFLLLRWHPSRQSHVESASPTPVCCSSASGLMLSLWIQGSSCTCH